MKTKTKIARLERGVCRDPVARSLQLFRRKREPLRKPYSRKGARYAAQTETA